MGFIDWHGNKENHYSDVIEYAKDRQAEEERLRQDEIIRKWMADLLGDQRFASIQSADLIRLLAREYAIVARSYDAAAAGSASDAGPINPKLLWNDLWYVIEDRVTELAGYEDAKKEAIMGVFADKVFRLSSATTVGQHLAARQTNRRYARYLDRCFTSETEEPLFWGWLANLKGVRKAQLTEIVSGVQRIILLMAYYLYLSTEKDGQWFFQVEMDWKNYNRIRESCKGKMLRQPDCRKMVNPLYNNSSGSVFDSITQQMRVLLFHFHKKTESKEGELKLIEELYSAIDAKRLPAVQIDTILPEDIRSQIQAGKLSAFPQPNVDGFLQDEKLFYLDHTVLYQGYDDDGSTEFRSYHGTIYITDQKIMFRGNGSIDLTYEHIDRIVEYDVLPEILEISCNGRENYFQLPNIDLAYRALKLVANRNRGQAVPESETPFNYEDLINQAELNACVFAFDYLCAGNLPDELKERISALIKKLKGLQNTLDRYPKHKEGIHQFMSYYIPEAIRVVHSFQRYQIVGLDEKMVDNVYSKVISAVDALDGAVRKKIIDIYRDEVMDTVARAEALREILGQDGYVDPAYELKMDRRI